MKQTPDTMYRVGIIGCGRIGSLLEDDPLREKPASHSGAFFLHPKTEIVAGCDTQRRRLRSFGKRWGVTELFTDYREMLDRVKPDIVSVATWTESHCEIAVEAAKRGVKGIYCEKPIALALEQADRMIEVCNQYKVSLVVGHERRWHPHYMKVREIIREGKIGTVQTVIGNALSGDPYRTQKKKPGTSSSRMPVKKYGGGPLFHDGTHLTDLLRYFLGEAEWVIGEEDRPYGNRNIESSASGMIRFKNGASAYIEGGGKREYFNFELDIQGTLGRIRIGNYLCEMWTSGESPHFSGFRELKKVEFPNPDREINPFYAGVEDLVRCMETGKPSVSDGQEGRDALEMILAIYQSARKGSRKIQLPLQPKGNGQRSLKNKGNGADKKPLPQVVFYR